MQSFWLLFGVAIIFTTKIAEVIRYQKTYHNNKNTKTLINFGQIQTHDPQNWKLQPQDLILGRNIASNQASLRVNSVNLPQI